MRLLLISLGPCVFICTVCWPVTDSARPKEAIAALALLIRLSLQEVGSWRSLCAISSNHHLDVLWLQITCVIGPALTLKRLKYIKLTLGPVNTESTASVTASEHLLNCEKQLLVAENRSTIFFFHLLSTIIWICFAHAILDTKIIVPWATSVLLPSSCRHIILELV